MDKKIVIGVFAAVVGGMAIKTIKTMIDNKKEEENQEENSREIQPL